MTFNEWWKKWTAGIKFPENTRKAARDAWYAAIDQTIHQQQRNQESERDVRLGKPLIEVLDDE